jgi:hypothetical protein
MGALPKETFIKAFKDVLGVENIKVKKNIK